MITGKLYTEMQKDGLSDETIFKIEKLYEKKELNLIQTQIDIAVLILADTTSKEEASK